MEQQKPYHEQESFLRAKEKFETRGWFGVTAEDHRAIHSTPPDALAEHPGKTLSELMSDQEIGVWVAEQKKSLEEFLVDSEFRESELGKHYLPSAISKLKTTLWYLKSVSRLPEEFKDFDPKDLV